MAVAKLRPVTAAVQENEPVYWMWEASMVRPPDYQDRRYLVMTVARNDAPADCWFDLGPAAEFTSPGFEMPVLGVHSVAECRDIALDLRYRDNHWKKFMEEQQAESTLVQDAIAFAEERVRRIENASTFGPAVTRQRNGLPSEWKGILHDKRSR